MTAAYKIASDIVMEFMNEQVKKYGHQRAGGLEMDSHTICIGENGSTKIIPLDILSDPVDLKKMWMQVENPVAIAFREWIYDWYCLIPVDASLHEWNLFALKGCDHNMVRARALAESAIRSDFGIDNAVVKEIH